jgi:hypothetical protein
VCRQAGAMPRRGRLVCSDPPDGALPRSWCKVRSQEDRLAAAQPSRRIWTHTRRWLTRAKVKVICACDKNVLQLFANEFSDRFWKA